LAAIVTLNLPLQTFAETGVVVNPIIEKCAHIRPEALGISLMSTEEFKALLSQHVRDLADQTLAYMDNGYGPARLGELLAIKQSHDYRVCTAGGLPGFWYSFAGQRSPACNRISARDNASGIGRELDGMNTMFELLIKGMALGKLMDLERDCISSYYGTSPEMTAVYEKMRNRGFLNTQVSFGVVNGYGAEKVKLLEERNDTVIARVQECMSKKNKAKGRRCALETQIQYYTNEFSEAVLRHSEAHRETIQAQLDEIAAFQD